MTDLELALPTTSEAQRQERRPLARVLLEGLGKNILSHASAPLRERLALSGAVSDVKTALGLLPDEPETHVLAVTDCDGVLVDKLIPNQSSFAAFEERIKAGNFSAEAVTNRNSKFGLWGVNPFPTAKIEEMSRASGFSGFTEKADQQNPWSDKRPMLAGIFDRLQRSGFNKRSRLEVVHIFDVLNLLTLPQDALAIFRISNIQMANSIALMLQERGYQDAEVHLMAITPFAKLAGDKVAGLAGSFAPWYPSNK